MDLGNMTTLISSVGFPIFACCTMFWLYNKQLDTINGLKTSIDELREKVGEIHSENK